MHVVFWQEMASSHMAPIMSSLAEMPGVDVSWLVDSIRVDYRNAMGWESIDAGKCKIIESPSEKYIDEMTNHRPYETAHIFSTDRHVRVIHRGMKSILRKGGTFGLMSETAKLTGFVGGLRIIHGKIRAMHLKSRIDFMLAIGSNGVRWYKMCGYPEQRIFPFAYITMGSKDYPLKTSVVKKESNVIDLIFIGQLIKRKGVDILLKALRGLEGLNWNLRIIGDGIEHDSLVDLCESLELSDKVQFLGSLKNSVAMEMLADSDLLVLPSRWDGWGAVVNESLMLGVPVVCSDNCGASDLLDGKQRGSVYRADSIEDLHDKLGVWLSRRKPTEENRMAIREWSACITGKRVASYLQDVLSFVYGNGSRPYPPWLQ